jgi:anaerobic magnesium-protoporphyrin IX monomethyl ester cyclase
MTSSLLLVEPPRVFWFVMGEYLPPPSSLLILAAYIERELPDVDIEIVDCQADRLDWKNLERIIESAEPSMVLSSGFTTNAYSCIRTCEIAKTVNPEIKTIVGGSHFSFTAEESLQNYPEIDFIVRGEGEQTVVELIKTIQNKGKIHHVAGISYRTQDAVVHTPPRPLIENLDILPYPAYHLVEKNLKRYHFTMMAGRNTQYMILEGARGCDHQCSFCTQWKHWGSRWRTKSPKRIADEIEYLHDTYGGVFLWFADDHMRIQTRGKQLYEELRRKKCTEDIMLFFQARIDDIALHPDLVGRLREVGTYWILTGVETNSEETLQEYKKGIKTQDAYQAMKVLRQQDIFSQAMFVIGGRKDTHESIEKLRQYSVDLNADLCIYTALTPFPGTIYYETAKKNGWIEDTNYTNYDMAHAIMPTEALTRKEVQEELWRCYRNFYGSLTRGITGVFAKNKLKRTIFQHMAGQFVLEKFRRLI